MENRTSTSTSTIETKLDAAGLYIDVPNRKDASALATIYKQSPNLREFFIEFEMPGRQKNGKQDIDDIEETEDEEFGKKEEASNEENGVRQGIETYTKNVSNGKLTSLVCRSKQTSEVLGVITYEIKTDRTLHIDILAVNPEHNGKRIGQYLIAQVVNEAKLKKLETVSAFTIGDSYTFWRRLFYDDHKDFYLSCGRFDNFLQSTISTPSKLFSFLNEKISNDSLQADITNILDTTKDVNLLKTAHTIEHYVTQSDQEEKQEGLEMALLKLLKYLHNSLSDREKENINKTSYFKMFSYILCLAKNYGFNQYTLLKNVIDNFKKEDDLNNKLCTQLKTHLKNIGLTVDRMFKNEDSDSGDAFEDESEDIPDNRFRSSLFKSRDSDSEDETKSKETSSSSTKPVRKKIKTFDQSSSSPELSFLATIGKRLFKPIAKTDVEVKKKIG